MTGVIPPNGGWEMIAVNNASSDDSQRILESFADRLPLRVLQQPLRGKNNALNRALEESLGETVVFTDDDVIAAPDWLCELDSCVKGKADFDVFGGSIEPYWELPPPAWILEGVPHGVTFALTDSKLPAGPIFPGLIWGPNMAVRRSVFEAGHRFNVNVGPAAGQYIMGSETEFNIRVGKAGHKSWFCPTARVQHIIRDFQMQQGWVTRRAYRFGRNACYQDYRETGPACTDAWCLGRFNFPRWMLRRSLEDFTRGHLARFAGNETESVRRLWDAAFHRGYMAQAQELRGKGADRPAMSA